MRTSALIAAIGRATGGFSEAWGGSFDPHDSHDLEAMSYLIAQELEALVQAEVDARLEEQAGEFMDALATSLREALSEWDAP